MKILMVLEFFKPHLGGVETLFDHLATELSKSGHEVTILTSNHTGHLPKVQIIDGIRIERLKVSSRYLFTLKAILPAYRLAKGADLVHTTSYNAAIPAFLAAWLNRKTRIITFHEVWGSLWFKLPFSNKISAFFHALFERFLLLLPFDLFVGVSQATEQRLLQMGISKRRVTFIYNGLNYPLTEVDPQFHKKSVYTYFGRLGISKGLDLLLPASISFLQNNPDYKLRLITPKEPLEIFEYLKKTVDTHQLTNQIEWLHEVSDKKLEQLLKESNWVVIPSYSEGFCFAAAESAALNVPIIASNKGSLPEVVSGYHLFFSPHSTEALISALEKAKNNLWEFKPLKKFELNQTTQKYILAYQQLLGR